MSAHELDLGYTGPELRRIVHNGLLDAVELGLAGRRVLSYLALIDPTLPGSYERLAYRREIRRRFGRCKRGSVHAGLLTFPPPSTE